MKRKKEEKKTKGRTDKHGMAEKQVINLIVRREVSEGEVEKQSIAVAPRTLLPALLGEALHFIPVIAAQPLPSRFFRLISVKDMY